MQEEEQRVVENKLYVIAEDLKKQMDNMHSMVLEISNLNVFRSDYIQINKYNEIELLERLNAYKHSTDICVQYFIKYREIEKIFTSDKYTYPFWLYYEHKIGGIGFEELTEKINTVCTETSEKVILCKEGNKVLFIYPMKKYASSKIGRNGAICFVISDGDFLKRIERVVGKIDGEISIYYKDFCVLGGTKTAGDNKQLEFCAEDFTISFIRGEEGGFSWKNIIDAKFLIALGTAFVLVFFAGYAGAWLNYRPAKRIADKYTGKLEADWDSIDALIASLLRGREKSSQLLREHCQILKEHLFQLITLGGYSEQVKNHLTLLGIQLDAPVYGSFVCQFENRENIGKRADICKDVEALSEEGITLFAYWKDSENLGVLAAIEEEYQMKEISELLSELLEIKTMPGKIQIVGVCHDLKEINNIFIRETNTDLSNLIKEVDEEADAKARLGERVAGNAVAYIKENCTNNQMTLGMVADEFHVSADYLSKSIKALTGMTYREYLIRLRMQKAKDVFENENVSVADVCQMVGYSNVSHFIKTFQKFTGVTPAKYWEMYH